MPLQIRVDPFGNLFRTTARGTIMGNRGGVLHANREIVSPYKSRRWITCVLEFKDRQRVVMSERRYTELFFLDEATAFAAGHRPCAECRRERFNAFKESWKRARCLDSLPFANEMDLVLHPARITKREKVTYVAAMESLPDGCFVQIDGNALLVWGPELLRWTPEGYTERVARRKDSVVTVLTPEPIVACFRQGYMPGIHHLHDAHEAVSAVGLAHRQAQRIDDLTRADGASVWHADSARQTNRSVHSSAHPVREQDGLRLPSQKRKGGEKDQ
jgi:hypothetical protein